VNRRDFWKEKKIKISQLESHRTRELQCSRWGKQEASIFAASGENCCIKRHPFITM